MTAASPTIYFCLQSVFHVSYLRGLFDEDAFKRVDMDNLQGASICRNLGPGVAVHKCPCFARVFTKHTSVTHFCSCCCFRSKLNDVS